MADDFDPEKYLAEKKAAQASFDPAKYLAEKTGKPVAVVAPAPEQTPTTPIEAFAGHAADNVPFMRQLAAAFEAAKLKASGNPMDFGENYRQLLTAQQRELNQSKAEHAGLSRLGSLSGLIGTAAALPGAGWKPLASLGFLSGLSDSTANPDATAGDVAKQTAISTVIAPVLGRAVEAAAPIIGRGLEATGGRLADLAGWLKINSVHPTPTLAETIENLSGGKAAAGVEALKEGIGGLTKGGTARQAQAAMDSAGKEIGKVVAAHDAAGGAQVNIANALSSGLDTAAELQASRFEDSRAAGKRLEDVINAYSKDYPRGMTTATDALAIKREIGDKAYRAGLSLAKSGDTVSGDYGQGLKRLERAVDGELDSAVGPAFSDANLAFRRLLGFSNAADRQAGRASANHLLGLLPSVVGAGELAAGHGVKDAGLTALVIAMANKYGSQASARALYSPVAGGLGLLGRGLRSPISGPLAGRIAAEESAPLAAGLYRPPMAQPMMANRDGLQRQQTLAQLLQGVVP